MKKEFKSIIKNNQYLFYLATFFRFNSGEKRKYLLEAIYSPNTLHLKHFGNNYPDKFVYNIKVDGNSGFAALYKWTLVYLFYANELNLIPVIEFDNNILYAEKNSLFGTKNPFEYYFLQPSYIAYNDIKKCKNTVFSKIYDKNLYYHIFHDLDAYEWNEEDVTALSEIHRKYIHFRPALDMEFQQNIRELIDENKTLAIHYRGTDYKKNLRKHPTFISLEMYFNEIDKIISEYDKIFLATDDIAALQEFKIKYKNKLIYFQDAIRSENTTGVHFTARNRKNDRYLLGKEVLRDIYVLANCDSLICGRSNVALIANVLNHASGKNYKKCVIIDYGIN